MLTGAAAAAVHRASSQKTSNTTGGTVAHELGLQWPLERTLKAQKVGAGGRKNLFPLLCMLSKFAVSPKISANTLTTPLNSR